METTTVFELAGWLTVGAVLLRMCWAGIGLLRERARQRKASQDELAGFLAEAARIGRASAGRPVAAAAPPGTRMMAMRVVERVAETADRSVCSLYLTAEDGSLLPPFKPGQFVSVEVPGGDGGPIRRCYSLSEMPMRPQRHYRISVKRLGTPEGSAAGTPNGVASTRIVEGIGKGDLIHVAPPAGSFVLDPHASPSIVLIAGGIGITPLMSMLKWLVASRSRCDIWLIYSVRNGAEHAFRNEILRLREAAPNLATIVFYSQPTARCRPGIDYDYAGRIDLKLLSPLLSARTHTFYVCGPDGMMEGVTRGLREKGVDPADIRTETFGTQRRSPAAVTAHAAASPGTHDHAVTFSASQQQAAWQPHYGSLLEFAEACGIDARFSCRAGQCGACKVRLRAGEVVYDTVPEADVEAGTCLPCVARPMSDLVVEL